MGTERSVVYSFSPKPKVRPILEQYGIPSEQFPNAEVTWQFAEYPYRNWDPEDFLTYSKLVFFAYLIAENENAPWIGELFGGHMLTSRLLDDFWETERLEEVTLFPDHHVTDDAAYISHPAVRFRLGAPENEKVQRHVDRLREEDHRPPDDSSSSGIW